FVVSIQSKAEMTASYVSLDNKGYPGKNYEMYYKGDRESASAPGRHSFDISGSKNSTSYELKFGDGEILVIDSAGTAIEHEYQKPGKYTVTLTTKSAKPDECTDSVTTEAELKYGVFALPNVFSPDQDYTIDNYESGQNDIFRSFDISVVTIDITIFDRAGTRMHTYSGDIRDWKGWDGRVKNSDREAPEGVYFWVVTSMIYFRNPETNPNPDQNEITKEDYSGFFHLYRQ
ncbi:MAG TPA: PKD domain-containing protein, partial [Bacteroidales bacterium]|nr:PKD domain-containing protein [Bacteroidales bacterium]